jgi:hypothetical protein
VACGSNQRAGLVEDDAQQPVPDAGGHESLPPPDVDTIEVVVTVRHPVKKVSEHDVSVGGDV